MRIAVISYQTLCQRTGGLQNQITETINALKKLGVDVEYFDEQKMGIKDFDILHVFASTHSNHLWIEEAKKQGVATALSPLLQPYYTSGEIIKLKLISKIAVKFSRYMLQTSHSLHELAILSADCLIAQSDQELKVIQQMFSPTEKQVTAIINNAIPEGYFQFNTLASVYPSVTNRKYIFLPGTICQYKNQLGAITAIGNEEYDFILAGPIGELGYLETCLKAGNGAVHYVGNLDNTENEYLSLYANATVTLLLSQGETCGLVALESLAIGTPVIMTSKTGIHLEANNNFLFLVSRS